MLKCPEPWITAQFRYNYLHDVEPLWWCAVYLLFFNLPEGKKETDEQASVRNAVTAAVFPERPLGGQRRNVLVNQEVLLEKFDATLWMEETQHSHAIATLVAATKLIVRAYRAFEKRLAEDPGYRAELPEASRVRKAIVHAFNISRQTFEKTDIVPAIKED